MAALATTAAPRPRAAVAPTSPRRSGPPHLRCQALLHTPRPSCRCRRCCARVMAFRWGESADTTTDNSTANKPITKLDAPTPPSLTPPNVPPTLKAEYLSSSGAVDEAIEEMQREERVRDIQCAAVEAFEGAKGWWSGLPDKRAVLIGGAGVVVGAYLGGAVLEAVDRVPLLPGLLQVVGFAFSCYFWWRFVLFAEGRRELVASLGRLRVSVADSVDGLAERTLESHPNAGGGETGASETARRVVGRMAARHQGGQEAQKRRREQQQQQQSPSLLKDDGSWLDEPAVNEGSPGLSEGYVAGLLQELDERDERSPSPGGGASGRPPAIFAFLMAAVPELMAAEPGAEEAAAVGGGTPPQGASPGSGSEAASTPTPTPTPALRTDKVSGIAGGAGSVGEEGHTMADLDPCLGWDTEACRASGHLKLGEPDKSKLESLEEAAFRQAKETTTFTHHVDEVLHEPSSRSHPGSQESVHLEGDYGRAAGTMEREVMEDMADKSPDAMRPGLNSTRKPAVGEEAGL